MWTLFLQREEKLLRLYNEPRSGQGFKSWVCTSVSIFEFVSALIESNNLPTSNTITPTDFCSCHLGPARITPRIDTERDPEKRFQLLVLISCAEVFATKHSQTSDKATKLRSAASIPNMKYTFKKGDLAHSVCIVSVPRWMEEDF